MLNVIILMGRATKDPEIWRTADDTAVVKFDLAVDNLGKEAGSSFFTIKCFSKVGENVSKFVRKGHKVAVQGRIEQRTYLAKDGSKRAIYEVLADSVEFLEPKAVETSKEESAEEQAPVEKPKLA